MNAEKVPSGRIGYNWRPKLVSVVMEGKPLPADVQGITRPTDVQEVIQDVLPELAVADREMFAALHLDARNRYLSHHIVSIGSLNASLVHPREVFVNAILAKAASIICCHNHPSGDTSPSREDCELTRRLVQAGEIVGIEVLDHVIVASDRILSLKEAELF